MKKILVPIEITVLILSTWAFASVHAGTPPSLTLFTPQINALTATINGVTLPGTPGTNIVRIHWDWGDGASEDHWFANAHQYIEDGVYTVVVTSYQSDGLTTTKTTTVELGTPTRIPILLLINETIYSSIADHLSLFRRDLVFDGYDSLISILGNGATPPQIKSILKSYYATFNISGCIMIGDIKAAYTEFRTGDSQNVWISLDALDMYYMDLDGFWENVLHPDFMAYRPPGDTRQVYFYPSCQTFYEEYIAYPNETKKWDYATVDNRTQYKAEIWVTRIMGHNLVVSGNNEVGIINSFLEWDHAYRSEHKPIRSSGYLLETWQSYGYQDMNFSELFDSVTKREYVNAGDYLTYLGDPDGSKLVYLGAHSGPQVHVMYDRSLTVDEIDNSNKTSVFYILNACSACRWDNYVSSPTNPNYLGGIYVFDKSEMDYGLGVIGFTGVGGFNVLNFFSDYLNMNPNGSYGEAYKYWFNENLMHTTSAWNYVYLGDPTIGPKIPSLVQNVQTGLRYEDIQDAINAPETLNGHTIIVGAGIYRENVVLNKTLSLVGEDRVRTILDGNGTGNVIYVTRDSVVISNFTVTNSGSAYPNSGIFLGSVGNSTISNNVVSHNQGYGIFLMWGSNNSVLDNIVEYNLQPGVRIDGATSGARVANNVIRFNQPDGIFLYYAFDIVIQDNLVVQNKQCGITPQGGSHNVTIRRNKIVNNGWHGILMVVSDSSTVEENEIVSNGFSGVDSVGASIGNVIQNNTVRENGCGISFSDSSSNFIYRNYFIDNFDQVRVQNSTNVWDNGYPIGGNYWGDYKGTDFFSGPYQNITGSDGIGDTPYVIDENNLDHYPLDVHNVAVMDVTVSKTIVCKGYLANFKIMVENQGNHPETFNVTIYAISLTDTSVIGRWEVTLSPGEKNTSSFVWNTTSFAKGNYTISSNASQVMDEIDIYDNAFADNWISVSTLGDINADGKVDVKDVYAVGRAYGTSLEGPNPSGRTYNPNCDINGDDKVDVKDYYIVCKHYGEVDP